MGIVKSCKIEIRKSINLVKIGNWSGVGDVAIYLVNNLTGVAYTEALTPDGDVHKFEFDPVNYCGKTLYADVVNIVIHTVDSFGVVRSDWPISIARETFRGETKLWLVKRLNYTIYIKNHIRRGGESQFPTRRQRDNSDRRPKRIPNLHIQPAPRRVYIKGPHTIVDFMPRQVELPPSLYQVVVEFGSGNVTYTIELKPGEIVKLTVDSPQLMRDTSQIPVWLFVLVVALLVAIAILHRRLSKSAQ